MKVVIFGDSITNGFGTDFKTQSDILKRTVEAKAPGVEVILRGINGEDSYDGLTRLEVVAQDEADVYVIFFGANDASTAHAVNTAEFLVNLTKMTERFGAPKTILLTPPLHNDATPDPTRSNKLVERFRESTLEVAKTTGAEVIDLYQAMRESPEPLLLLKDDGLHFSKAGYELLSSLIAERLKARVC
ncbi:MAG: GDSL-type esterase/lipase family protein [Streptococcaceae bacterium]|jgi:lysophospholipase L1-like esterase|nr:GDSL-type esterase/lipase family protein [Streptococcaceae bacterium]